MTQLKEIYEKVKEELKLKNKMKEYNKVNEVIKMIKNINTK